MQYLTYNDLVRVLSAKLMRLIEVRHDYDSALLEVRAMEAYYMLQISSDKDWLKSCNFAQNLQLQSLPSLSNDKGREAALTLAKQYDPMLAPTRQHYDHLKSYLFKLENQIEALKSVERLFIAGSDKLPLSAFDSSFQEMFLEEN